MKKKGIGGRRRNINSVYLLKRNTRGCYLSLDITLALPIRMRKSNIPNLNRLQMPKFKCTEKIKRF